MHKPHPGLYQAFLLSPTCDDLDLAGQRWKPKVCILSPSSPLSTHTCRQPQIDRLGGCSGRGGPRLPALGLNPPSLPAEHPECGTPAAPCSVWAGLGLRLEGFHKRPQTSASHQPPGPTTEEIAVRGTLTHTVGAFSGLKKKE